MIPNFGNFNFVKSDFVNMVSSFQRKHLMHCRCRFLKDISFLLFSHLPQFYSFSSSLLQFTPQSLHLHSSLVDAGCKPQASQLSSKFVILVGQAGQGNAPLTEILVLAHLSLPQPIIPFAAKHSRCLALQPLSAPTA